MKKAMGIFLKQKLKLENTFLASMGELSVETVPFTSRSKIKEEVIVTFSTVEVRDIVRRAARELGGDPSSGIRLEIPRFLQRNLKALESVSFALKRKHAEMKRNIKYDDEKMDLVLDFCINPSDPDSTWKKIRPDQAALVRGKIAGNASSEEMSGDDIG